MTPATLAAASAVHYLPIATTAISAAFLAALLRRSSKKGWPPHLNWWAIGVFFYGLGTALESTITLFGNDPLLNRLWYWAGAILGGYPLATGSVYLLAKRSTANILTAISLTVVIVASVAVFLTPINADLIDAVRPSGKVLEWQWVRLMTPFINLYAAAFLIGGAMFSSIKFAAASRGEGDICKRCSLSLAEHPDATECPECSSILAITRTTIADIRSELRRRAMGTALIALGGILPGIGGSMAKAGIVEGLYVGELAGLILIWAGYELCTRVPAPRPQNAAPPE